MTKIPILTSRQHRIFAVAAIVCIAIGFPEIRDGFQASARGESSQPSGWSTAATILALPSWLWAAYSCARRKQWGWLLAITILSHGGMLAYLVFGARGPIVIAADRELPGPSSRVIQQ
jgi:hypothetical protein